MPRENFHNDQPTQSGRDVSEGRAFSWLPAVMVIVGLVIAGIAFWNKLTPAENPERASQPASPALSRALSEIPDTSCTDITKAAGIKFVHNNGAYGDKLLPETMGGGVAFFDFDNDGDQDLLFINSAPWPWRPQSGPRPTMALYRNEGQGRFDDVTAGSGLD